MAQKKENKDTLKLEKEFRESLKRLEKLGFQVAYYGDKNKKVRKEFA